MIATILLWELLFEVIKRFDINVKFKKVKAHSGNIHNDKADFLAKSRCDNSIVTFKDNISLEKSRLYWFNHNVNTNVRTFIRQINEHCIDTKLDSLNRVNELSSTSYSQDEMIIEKQWSIEAISTTNSKSKENNLKYLSIKQDKNKAFCIKKLYNELPTMEILKKRKPKVYKDDFLCPRCGDKKETINHLWLCSKADNDILRLQRIARDKLIKWIKKSDKFRNVDLLIDELFPFFKTSKQ